MSRCLRYSVDRVPTCLVVNVRCFVGSASDLRLLFSAFQFSDDEDDTKRVVRSAKDKR